MSDGWGTVPSGRRYGSHELRTGPAGSFSQGPNPSFQTSAPAAGNDSGVFNNHSFTETFMGLGHRAIQGNGFMNSPLYKKLDQMDAKEVGQHYDRQQNDSTYDTIMARASEPPKNVRPKNLNPPSKDGGWGGDAEDEEGGGDE